MTGENDITSICCAKGCNNRIPEPKADTLKERLCIHCYNQLTRGEKHG